MKENLIDLNQAQVSREEKKQEKENSENAIGKVSHEIANMAYAMQQNLNDAVLGLKTGEIVDIKKAFRDQVKEAPLELFNPKAELPDIIKQVMAKLDKDINKALGPDISEAEKNVIVRLAFEDALNDEYAREISPEILGGLAEEIAAEEEERQRFKKAA